jgi:hypothetical protein
MATHSRSGRCFLERMGCRPTRRNPTQRFDVGGLKVHTIPLDQSQLNPNCLLDAAGSPPPDRGKLDPWPPPQEVTG